MKYLPSANVKCASHMKYRPLADVKYSPKANVIVTVFSFAAQKNDMLLRNMIYRLFPASSMVVTPHWGDYSLSDDLTSDEISATGGPQRFARYDRFVFDEYDMFAYGKRCSYSTYCLSRRKNASRFGSVYK